MTFGDLAGPEAGMDALWGLRCVPLARRYRLSLLLICPARPSFLVLRW